MASQRRERDDVARQLRPLTDTAAECVALLPTAIEHYATGDPAFADIADRVGALESRCDSQVRSFRASLSDQPADFTGQYLHAPDLLDVVYRVDRIASATEQFVAELGAIEPALGDATLDTLAEHARRSAAAADRLHAALDATVAGEDASVPPGVDETLEPRDHVDAIRATESACDRLKYELLGEAEGPAGSVLLVRQFAVTLDEIPNAVEDAADSLAQLRIGSV